MSIHSFWSHFRTSFQLRLFLIFSLLTAFIATFLCTLYITSEIKVKRDYARERVLLQAQQLAYSVRLPLYAENRAVLRQFAEQAGTESEIRTVVISASDGRILANVHVPTTSDSSGMIIQTVEVHSNMLADSVESSMSGRQNASPSRIGTIRIERGTADLSHALRKFVILSVSSAIVFWMLVSLLSYLALRKVTHSFNSLMHGIKALQNGDLTTRIDISTDDEPGRAALAINNLASVLQQRSEENIRLQDERLKIERQMLTAHKLESLGVMAGGIAHDFNNLLQSILGNMEMALMKLESDSAPQKHITNAMKSGKRAAHLTSLMLTYVGGGYVSKKQLNLNELVRENVEILKTAASTAVSMEMCLSAELPDILADEANIQQVIMNLIINAAESIEEQPGCIILTTGTQYCDQTCLSASLLNEKPEPGHFVFLEVIDNGCGMSNETLKRLFDPFFTTKFTGRGLGMSAVMGIMRSHGGALFVESQPGKGTTFRTLFPTGKSGLPGVDQTLIMSAPEKSTLQETTLSGVALVVDDEKSVLKICTKMVNLCGFSVITACDGIDAVAKYRKHADEIVIVLMDLTMPNMDGITAMEKIFNFRPDAKVILSSGFNEGELDERFTSHSPSGFICKPYSMNVLETEMRRVLQGG